MHYSDLPDTVELRPLNIVNPQEGGVEKRKTRKKRKYKKKRTKKKARRRKGRKTRKRQEKK